MKTVISFNININYEKVYSTSITTSPINVVTDSDVNKSNIYDCLKGLDDICELCNANILTLSDWMHAMVHGRILNDNGSERFCFSVNDLYAMSLEKVRGVINNIIHHPSGQILTNTPLDKITIQSGLDDKIQWYIFHTLDALKIKERYPDFYDKCIKKLSIPLDAK